MLKIDKKWYVLTAILFQLCILDWNGCFVLVNNAEEFYPSIPVLCTPLNIVCGLVTAVTYCAVCHFLLFYLLFVEK